ncbi:MAG: SRPBCC family protein [Elusimicrobia bacterium]|nr:SRPBCC family protein [Elusimicrobiota bacterium]
MVKGVLIFLAAGAVLFAAVGSILPDQYEITRSIEIKEHPIKVYLWVGELRSWPQWWPWKDLDPAAKFSFGAQTSGVGSTVSLKGRPGPGRVKITESSPTAGIAFDYSFDSGAGDGRGSIEFRVLENATIATWRVRGRSATPVLKGYLAAVADSMHGGMLDWGLNNLKSLVEADKRELFGAEPPPQSTPASP